MKRLVILAALLAAPVSAQNTNCQWIGSMWNCNTIQPVQPGGGIDWGRAAPPQQGIDFRALMEARRQGQEDRARADAMRAQQEMTKRQQEQQAREEFDRSARDILRRMIVNDLQAGKCPEAQARALSAGDIEMAAQVKQFCAKP